jgi:hypothetical protein
MNCKSFSCLSASPSACKSPEVIVGDGAIYTPFVEMQFSGNAKLTVGNHSAAGNNMAAITSFTYGFGKATNHGIEIEIIDHGATLYPQIVDLANKTIDEIDPNVNSSGSNVLIDFGWILRGTDDATFRYTVNSLTGYKIGGIINDIDQTYEGGNMKITIKIGAAWCKTMMVKHNRSIFSEDAKGSLKEALRKLFTEHDPKFAGVKFLRTNDKGDYDNKEWNFKTSDQGPDGPKGTWPMNESNPYATACSWLQNITTDADKGIVIAYDNINNLVLFLEDNFNEKSVIGRNIATYIVNGGNCGPVLSFSPKINWAKGLQDGSGATAGGAASGDNSRTIKPSDEVEKKVGHTVYCSGQEHDFQWRSPDQIPQKASNGLSKHSEANTRKGIGAIVKSGLTAELKVVGDPFFYSLKDHCLGASLCLFVINPFYINGNAGNYQWITTSNCNLLLTNKNWFVEEISHQISGGTFVTTLNLSLATPNIDLDARANLGGDNSDGPKLPGSDPATSQ